MDVREGAVLDNDNMSEEFGELLVVADGELDVLWDYARLLVVTCGVARKLEHLGDEYSSTAAVYTGAPAPMRCAYLPSFRCRASRPTGNCKPAFCERETCFFACSLSPLLPLPLIFLLLCVPRCTLCTASELSARPR